MKPDRSITPNNKEIIDNNSTNQLNRSLNSCLLDTFYLNDKAWHKININGIDGFYIKKSNNKIVDITVVKHISFNNKRKSYKKILQKWIHNSEKEQANYNDLNQIISLIRSNKYKKNIFRSYIYGNKLHINIKNLDTKRTKRFKIDIKDPTSLFHKNITASFNICRKQYIKKYFPKFDDEDIHLLPYINISKRDIEKIEIKKCLNLIKTKSTEGKVYESINNLTFTYPKKIACINTITRIQKILKEQKGKYIDKIKNIYKDKILEDKVLKYCKKTLETIYQCLLYSEDMYEKDICLEILHVIELEIFREKTILTSNKINKPKHSTLFTVYYGTNRKPDKKFSGGYGNNRAHTLYTGKCKVLIPREHKKGEIKDSLLTRIVNLISNKNSGNLELNETIRFKNRDDLWYELRKLFSKNDKKQALIFIHGYNNSFKDAAIRAAQLGFDLGINGITAFYSWPSKGEVTGYSSDEATIQASEKYIKEFLVGFAKKSGAKIIHIIAHSMGNRGLLRVINDINKEYKDIKFNQIILAAPDIDTDVFKNISKAYTKLAKRTTLYISPKDKAVWASKIKHRYPRAGLSTPRVTIVDNIDTVEVDFDFDLLEMGHGYFAEQKKLLNDIVELIKHNSPPAKRKNLHQKDENGEQYWLLNI
jgi:esterase/lipase superfamily enzyme